MLAQIAQGHPQLLAIRGGFRIGFDERFQVQGTSRPIPFFDADGIPLLMPSDGVLPRSSDAPLDSGPSYSKLGLALPAPRITVYHRP